MTVSYTHLDVYKRQAYRLAAGNDFAHKLIGLGQTIGPAFADFAPGRAPLDWLVAVSYTHLDVYKRQAKEQTPKKQAKQQTQDLDRS